MTPASQTHWVILFTLSDGTKRYYKRPEREYRGDFTALRSNARRYESQAAALHIAYEMKAHDRMVADFTIECFHVVAARRSSSDGGSGRARSEAHRGRSQQTHDRLHH